MKEHFCLVENTLLSFEGQCNWCGEKEGSMTQDDLKLVLDVLKWCHGGEPCGTAEAIAVVEKALAQPHETTLKEFNQQIHDDPNYHIWVKEREDVFKPEFNALQMLANDNQRMAKIIAELDAKRTWVDLTQQELDELDEQSPSLHDFVQNLMSKLKDKNCVG